ncbi:complement C3-like [Salvelinus fontinalis]|uniref:complement C3-like n=1 Tax=Salvelinus fontinalis TaxID=8038 RepID=UPI0024859725|nr:complement C3-like [Salvelinus fontinalis]
MMRVELVLLAAVALSLPMLSKGEVLYVMSAPNPLRVGSMERVFVEAQDYSGVDFNVKLTVKNFPAKDKLLASTSVSLNLVNKYQALMEVNILEGPDIFDEDYTVKQYVYLQAEFPGSSLEKVVLVSFQTGYIFVQTDKTIYTPESKVYYRVFALNTGLEPVTDIINVEIMNPDGITLKQDNYKPQNGMTSGAFPVPEITSYGNWKVVANFKNTPHKNFTADFEVKEYVLPSFEVKLTVSKSFFYVDDDELSVNIDARYLFGKPVTGSGFVVFGVIQGDGRTSFPSSLQRVELKDGGCKAVLKIQHIKETFPDINNLLQKSLYISVNVLTDTGSEMVKAEKKGIFIVKSPYSIHFKKTPLYFKPGMPYDISVYVTNPDDSPAKGIDVEALHNDKIEQGRTHDNGIAKMTINTDVGTAELHIMVKTNVNVLGEDRQGTQTMTAKPYKSKDNSQNYIHINIHSAEVKIEDRLKIDISLGSSPAAQHDKHEITYLILSKGHLISSQRLEWRKGQGLVTHPLTVNKDMIPSFRIVAYYHVGQNEVVSDSVWVDVKDTCMGSLKVDAVSPSGGHAPGDELTLSVIGDSEARVGLVAVDNGVYILNDKNRLTQTKIWDIIEKHDTGCTAGSGMDSMGVFYDAGLVFASNTAGGTPQRTVASCPVNSRRRRAVTINDVVTTLASQYTGLERQCCMDGMRKNILDYTCERRAQYISDGTECVESFLKCCREMATKREEAKTDQLILARSEEEDFENFNNIISRSFFPESWLWNEESLPQCPDNKQCPMHNIKMTLPDSITSWQITAIGLSKTHGICVSEPLKIIVWKNFFLDLKLPYSAVRNEQLEIKAILHNYRENSITVRVELRETSDVCSSASKKGRYIVTVMVDPRSTRSVPFVIIPMKLGLHTIEVKASVRDWGGRDGVKKELRVVPEGVLTRLQVKKVELDPAKHGGTDTVRVRSGALVNQVPNTPARTHISVTGEQLASTIEAAISGSPLGDLLRQPGGCGEQNMIGMTLPLIATHYLDTTKQWDKVGLERRNQAVNYIQRGYDQQLAYRKSDGSYAAFDHERSGTWLTAYVAKVFAMSNSLIVISEDVLCSAVKWLVMERQRPNGIFEETGKLLHPTMMGDVLGKDVDDTLTAFVLITMQEAHTICKNYDGISNLPESIKKAKQYLEFRNQHLTNPYSVAMTSYALANEGKLNQSILFKHSSTDRTHWPVSENRLLTLEATAYALLALVKAGAIEEAGPIVRWLKSQGFQRGGDSSTQSTIMVFQAVAEYMTKAGKVKDIDLNVDIDISGRTKVIKWSFSKSNALLTRTDKVQLHENFTVTAKGTGQGELLVTTLYYAMPKEENQDCKNFVLDVKLTKQATVALNGATETYMLHIDVLFKSDRNATMTILDISLLTGFVVDFEDLKQLSTGTERYIQKFEMDKKLSERGSLIIYLVQVSNELADRVAFRIHKVQDVGLLQPVGVTVYEYYAQENRCVKFYHPKKKDGTLNRLCQDDVCHCAEESCSFQKKHGDVSEVKLLDKACEAGMDYVFKASLVKNTTLESYIDTYLMEIKMIIKEGTDLLLEGEKRLFLAHPSCRETLDLEKDKSYLLMGDSAGLIQSGDRFEYVLGERTWIEYWPTTAECNIRGPIRKRCLEINDFVHVMENEGCVN